MKSRKELEYEIKKTETIIKNSTSKYLIRDQKKYLSRLKKELKNKKEE